MKIQLNPTLATLPVYQPGRPIEEVARELDIPAGDIIKLASNENPLGPSRKAVAAVKTTASQMHLYPDGNAFYFKQKLAEKLQVTPAHLILGSGSNEIIEFIGHALMASGVDVIGSEYAFAIYPIVARLFGANYITIPAKNHGHDLPAMLNAITPNTKVILVADPNNPTGTHVSNADLLDFIKKVPPHILVAIDQAYVEYLDDPLDLISMIKNGECDNVISMRTFSKIHGLAGLRLGYGIAHPELVSALEKIRQPFNINILAQAAGIAALDDENHVLKTRKNNTHGLKFFEKQLKAMNIEFIPSHGNFILIRVGNGQEIFDKMQRLGVITRPMGGYKLPEWLRISIGTPKENQRCITALRQAMGREESLKIV